MATANGFVNGTTSNEYISVKMEWEYTSHIDSNTTDLFLALKYKRTNTGYTTYGDGTFSIAVSGKKLVSSKTLSITGDEWVTALSTTVKIEHDANGEATVSFSGSGNIPGTTLTSSSVSHTLKLATIPRATTIDSLSCATKYFNGTMTYKYTPKSANFYNRCNIALNLDGTYTAVKTINLGKKSTSQKTATVALSEDELAIIYKKLPSATTGKLRFTFRTYTDSGYSTQIGDAGYKEITLSIPNTSDTQPTATLTLSPVNDLSSPFSSLYIQGKTKVQAKFNDAKGKYGASVVSYKFSMGGKTFASPYITEYLTTAGFQAFSATLTDSRGYSRTYKPSITVIPYANPRIIPASGESEIVCARCDANGNLSDSGTYLKIKAKRSYSKVVSGEEQKNFCSIRFRYKAESGSYSSWTTILASDSASDEVSTNALLGGNLLPESSYVVQVGVVDTLGEAESISFSIPTDKIYMHRAGSINSLGIGKYVEEENMLDVAEDITTKFRGKVSFAGEAWLNLGLSASVAESESNAGRWGGTGCYYRVCAGEKHVYVAFNCAFTYSGEALQVNAEPIPSAYRPDRNVYALCATGGRAIARILVNKSGYIIVDWIQIISSAEATNSSTVKWIDGYIDYWT